MCKSFTNALVLILVVSCAALSQHSSSKLVAIKCGKLIDGKSDKVMEHVVILVEDNHIKQVGQNVAIPPNTEVVDLTSATVLPGFIDCHTHLLLHEGDYDEQLLKESIAFRAIRGVVAAKQTLDAGFTTVRDVETEGAMYDDEIGRASCRERV